MRMLVVVFGLVAATAAAAPPAETRMENGRLVTPAPIVFETGTATLKPESDVAIDSVRAFLAARDMITLLRIEGHTASDGKEQDNQALSEKRAFAVVLRLVSKGIDCRRLLPVGFGSSKPVAPNDSPENKAKNLRIELMPAALRGHAIGGMPVDGGGRVAGDPCR